MSADGDADAGDGDGDDGGPGRREVAQRVLAAEFDDATVSYRESDEERAPNYVVTPTGARINRLFAVGVLTEVEPVNDDVVRARIADPTDAFVSYAGQYQPDPLAFFERADPPAFVALTGKARTFEPDDGDRIYTSVRPESVNAVEAGTRDRWVVSAAEATLERVALFEEALAAGERGDALRDRLRSAGHREALAAGIPVAIERYGTTPAYLEAVRRTAVEALELVAGDRESVGGIDVAPDEGEPAEVGPTPEPSPVSADADGPDARAAGPDAGGGPGDGSADAATGEVDGESGPAAAEAADGDDAAADEAAQAATDGTAAADEAAQAATDGTAAADEAAGSAGAADGSDDAAAADGTTAADEPPTADDPVAADDGTSDDGSGLGDFDGGSLGGEEEGAESAPAGGGGAASVDEDEMYELDDEERREVEEEYGTEFSTGSEVDDPGEADIDVDVPADAAAVDGDDAAASGGAEATGGEADAADTADAGDGAAGSDDTDDAAGSGADADATAEAGSDVDLEDAAVAAMTDLDDGDGADREAVVARVVEAHGADPGAVEDAIQDALMSGRCYEPNEGTLKPI